MRNKAVLSFIACLVLAASLAGCGGALTVTSTAAYPVDVMQDPIQTACDGEKPIIVETKDGRFTITPVAAYQVAATVAGSERYSTGWTAEISPCDLALAWGDLTKPEVMPYIKYSQSGRWYFYRYQAECPVSGAYIASHSSNHHIIPAGENIRRAVLSVRRKENVLLEGYLVSVSGSYKGGSVWWRSSLSRSDTGDGACELLYVTRVQIDSNVYE